MLSSVVGFVLLRLLLLEWRYGLKRRTPVDMVFIPFSVAVLFEEGLALDENLVLIGEKCFYSSLTLDLVQCREDDEQSTRVTKFMTW